MSELTMRPALKSDLPSLMAINEAARPGVYPLESEALTAASHCAVAELEGVVIGYLIAYTEGDTCEGDEFAWFQAHLPTFLYIDQIAVAQEARRAHVGTALYMHVIEWARERRIPTLVCEVNLEPPNPASLHFHARLGFEQVGVLQVEDGRTVALLQMDVAQANSGSFSSICARL